MIPNTSGNVSVKLLLCKYRVRKYVRFTRKDGIAPVILFACSPSRRS